MGLQTEQAGYHLQVVFDAVVNLLKEYLFFQQRRLEVSLHLLALGDIAGDDGGAGQAAVTILDGRKA